MNANIPTDGLTRQLILKLLKQKTKFWKNKLNKLKWLLIMRI